MRLLRHPLLCRFVVLALLAGLGGWASAPLAAAHPRVAAAQAAQALAGGPLERALADALAEAARQPDAPGAFEAALVAALAAQPDGDAFARYVQAAGSPEALLDLLVGQLLRNAAAPGPWLAAAAGPAPVTPPAPGTVRAVPPPGGGTTPPPGGSALSQAPPSPDAAGLLAVLSAAQPLGP